MMTFGWSPQQSCFVPTQSDNHFGPVPTSTDDQVVAAGDCSRPTWWYALMVLSAIAGVSARGR